MLDKINHRDSNGYMQGVWEEVGENWQIKDDDGNNISTTYKGVYVNSRRKGVWKYISAGNLRFVDHFVEGMFDDEIIELVYNDKPVYKFD